MTQARAVAMGLEKFETEYSKRPGGNSTQGQIAGYRYFERSKRADNNRRAQSLSLTRQRQLRAARESLALVGAAAWEMRYFAAGGGTMWGQMAAAAGATREEFLARFIDSLARPVRDSSSSLARRSARMALDEAERDLKRLHLLAKQQTPNAETLLSRGEARDALARLRRLCNLLPGTSAQLLARRARDEVQNPLNVG